MKRRLRIRWTCCDNCHTSHANRLTAWMHWAILRITHRMPLPKPPA